MNKVRIKIPLQEALAQFELLELYSYAPDLNQFELEEISTSYDGLRLDESESYILNSFKFKAFEKCWKNHIINILVKRLKSIWHENYGIESVTYNPFYKDLRILFHNPEKLFAQIVPEYKEIYKLNEKKCLMLFPCLRDFFALKGETPIQPNKKECIRNAHSFFELKAESSMKVNAEKNVFDKKWNEYWTNGDFASEIDTALDIMMDSEEYTYEQLTENPEELFQDIVNMWEQRDEGFDYLEHLGPKAEEEGSISKFLLNNKEEAIQYIKEYLKDDENAEASMINYLDFEIMENGNLKIIANEEAQKEMMEELEDVENKASDQVMYDIFEDLIANSELDWITPEELGALTDAPLLTDCHEVWYFNDYALRSPVEDLLSKGEVVFHKAEMEKDWQKGIDQCEADEDAEAVVYDKVSANYKEANKKEAEANEKINQIPDHKNCMIKFIDLDNVRVFDNFFMESNAEIVKDDLYSFIPKTWNIEDLGDKVAEALLEENRVGKKMYLCCHRLLIGVIAEGSSHVNVYEYKVDDCEDKMVCTNPIKMIGNPAVHMDNMLVTGPGFHVKASIGGRIDVVEETKKDIELLKKELDKETSELRQISLKETIKMFEKILKDQEKD